MTDAMRQRAVIVALLYVTAMFVPAALAITPDHGSTPRAETPSSANPDSSTLPLSGNASVDEMLTWQVQQHPNLDIEDGDSVQLQEGLIQQRRNLATAEAIQSALEESLGLTDLQTPSDPFAVGLQSSSASPSDQNTTNQTGFNGSDYLAEPNLAGTDATCQASTSGGPVTNLLATVGVVTCVVGLVVGLAVSVAVLVAEPVVETAQEEIGDVQRERNGDGTCTVYRDEDRDGHEDPGEESVTAPCPNPAVQENEDGTITVYDDKDRDGEVDDGEEIATTPIVEPRLTDNPDGTCTIWNDEDRDDTQDDNEELVTIPCPNPKTRSNDNGTITVYDDKDDDGEVDDGEEVVTTPATEGPYTDVRDDGPDCSGADTVYLDRVGSNLTFQGETYGHVVRDECVDAGALPRTVTYPSGVERGPDRDSDGVPAYYNVTASSVTVEEDGTTTGPNDAGTYDQAPADPDDSDPTNPIPSTDGPHTSVQNDGPDCTGTDTVYVDKLGGGVTFQGTTHEVVVEDQCIDAEALPLTVTYPSGVEEGPDRDNDGVPAYYNVTQSNVTVEEDGSTSGPTPAGTAIGVPGDPDDHDPTYPIPHVEGPFASVQDDGPDCEGADKVYVERVGGRVTFDGSTTNATVADRCLDADALPVTVTYPSGVEPGPDRDNDTVAAHYNVTASNLTIDEDGDVTGPEPAGTFATLPGDPDDTDNPLAASPGGNDTTRRSLLHVDNRTISDEEELPPEPIPGVPVPNVPGTDNKSTPDIPGVGPVPIPDYPGTDNESTPDYPGTNPIATPDYPGTGPVPTPDYPGTENESTPDYPGTEEIETPEQGEAVGNLTLKNRPGNDYCVRLTPKGGETIPIACVDRVFLGPADPLLPRRNVTLVVADPPDVPGTPSQPVPDVPGTPAQPVPDVPGTPYQPVPNVPGTPRQNVTDVPGTENKSTPDVPGVGPVPVPDYPGTNETKTPDVPGVENGSVGSTSNRTVTVDVAYHYQADRLQDVATFGGGIVTVYAPIAPTMPDVQWYADNADAVGLSVNVTLYEDGKRQGSTVHTVPFVGQALAASEASAGTLP